MLSRVCPRWKLQPINLSFFFASEPTHHIPRAAQLGINPRKKIAPDRRQPLKGTQHLPNNYLGQQESGVESRWRLNDNAMLVAGTAGRGFAWWAGAWKVQEGDGN
jgi:hypothetical protein